MNSLPIKNVAFYRFFKPECDLSGVRQKLREAMSHLEIKGTILLSNEGLNCFIAGLSENVDSFLQILFEAVKLSSFDLKISFSQKVPFQHSYVKIKAHIVPKPGNLSPHWNTHSASRLSPEELHRWISEGRKMILLDTRNEYEYQIGRFADSHHLGTHHFSDFEKDLDKTPQSWKEIPVVTFCTGGIRCEKAAPLMLEKGFREIYQLEGGILNYFEKMGRGYFEGSCFVFDERVALNDQLAPTGEALCYGCHSIVSVEEQNSPAYQAPNRCPHCPESTR